MLASASMETKVVLPALSRPRKTSLAGLRNSQARESTTKSTRESINQSISNMTIV
jgi:hypothetical protein